MALLIDALSLNIILSSFEYSYLILPAYFQINDPIMYKEF